MDWFSRFYLSTAFKVFLLFLLLGLILTAYFLLSESVILSAVKQCLADCFGCQKTKNDEESEELVVAPCCTQPKPKQISVEVPTKDSNKETEQGDDDDEERDARSAELCSEYEAKLKRDKATQDAIREMNRERQLREQEESRRASEQRREEEANYVQSWKKSWAAPTEPECGTTASVESRYGGINDDY